MTSWSFCKDAGLRDDAVARHKLARVKVGLEGWAALCWKVAWMQSRGEVPNAEASIAFLYGTQQRLIFAQEAMEILGKLGTLTPECDAAPIQGAIEGSEPGEHAHARRWHDGNSPQHHRPAGPGASQVGTMDLSLSESQEMLRRTAREFLESNCPTTLVRELEDSAEGVFAGVVAANGGTGMAWACRCRLSTAGSAGTR